MSRPRSMNCSIGIVRRSGTWFGRGSISGCRAGSTPATSSRMYCWRPASVWPITCASALPFSLWLREMASDRIIDLHRRHRVAVRRSLDQDSPYPPPISVIARRSSWRRGYAIRSSPPPRIALRQVLHQRFLDALDRMDEEDREVPRHAASRAALEQRSGVDSGASPPRPPACGTCGPSAGCGEILGEIIGAVPSQVMRVKLALGPSSGHGRGGLASHVSHLTRSRFAGSWQQKVWKPNGRLLSRGHRGNRRDFPGHQVLGDGDKRTCLPLGPARPRSRPRAAPLLLATVLDNGVVFHGTPPVQVRPIATDDLEARVRRAAVATGTDPRATGDVRVRRNLSRPLQFPQDFATSSARDDATFVLLPGSIRPLIRRDRRAERRISTILEFRVCLNPGDPE